MPDELRDVNGNRISSGQKPVKKPPDPNDSNDPHWKDPKELPEYWIGFVILGAAIATALWILSGGPLQPAPASVVGPQPYNPMSPGTPPFA